METFLVLSPSPKLTIMAALLYLSMAFRCLLWDSLKGCFLLIIRFLLILIVIIIILLLPPLFFGWLEVDDKSSSPRPPSSYSSYSSSSSSLKVPLLELLLRSLPIKQSHAIHFILNSFNRFQYSGVRL